MNTVGNYLFQVQHATLKEFRKAQNAISLGCIIAASLGLTPDAGAAHICLSKRENQSADRCFLFAAIASIEEKLRQIAQLIGDANKCTSSSEHTLLQKDVHGIHETRCYYNIVKVQRIERKSNKG
jgi:hypothetical protein